MLSCNTESSINARSVWWPGCTEEGASKARMDAGMEAFSATLAKVCLCVNVCKLCMCLHLATHRRRDGGVLCHAGQGVCLSVHVFVGVSCVYVCI